MASKDPTKPSLALLSKLGSVLVHIDEFRSLGGHQNDLDAITSIVRDPEVVEWMMDMGALALLPRRRDA